MTHVGHRLRRGMVALLAAVAALGAPCTAGAVTVASYNLYFGVDLGPIAAAQTQQEFVAAVGAGFANVQATNFNIRANAIADQIAAQRPDFVGLQEVATWRTGPGLNPAPATTVAFDFLPTLTAALAARGLSYTPVAQIAPVDIEVPGLLPTGLVDIRFTEADVLLARTDLPSGITHANAQAGTFAAAVPVTVAGQSLVLRRGFVAADVTADGVTFRLISTHLEPVSDLVRTAQALELLAGPASAGLPVLLVGDLNAPAAPPSPVSDAAYLALLSAGFTDAGLLGGIGNVATCCQATDLLNPVSQLATRVDLALFRGPFGVAFADVLGESPADRTASGLWPSDHAGIVVGLSVPEPSTIVLLAAGLAVLAVTGRRARRPTRF